MPKSPPKSYLQRKEQAAPRIGYGAKLRAELEKRSVAYLIGGVFLLLGIGAALLINATNAGKEIRAWVPGIPEGPGTKRFVVEGYLMDLDTIPVAGLTVVLGNYEGVGDKTDEKGYFYLNPVLSADLKKVELLILDANGELIYTTEFALLENELTNYRPQKISLPDEVMRYYRNINS